MGEILITGVTGFIGSHLANYYIEKGQSVIGIGVGQANSNDRMQYYEMDLRSETIEPLLLNHNVDLIIHCAGNASVPLSVQDPCFDFGLNTVIPYKLMESCKRFPGIRVVNLSSASVYGNPRRLPVKETDEVAPISPYALNKMLGEEICSYYRRMFGIDTVNVRIFSTYGPGLRKQLFWDMFKKIEATGSLELFGTGNESRDYIFIDDLVRAIDLVAKSDNNTSLINIANGEEITIREAAEIFLECMGVDKSKLSFNCRVREGDPLNWRADISKLQQIGYKKTVDIQEGIARYCKWVLSIE